MKLPNVHLPSKVLTHILIAASLLLAIGCSRPESETATVEAAPPEAEVILSTDIPLTASSEAALELYAEGLYFLDVGRGVQAGEKFRAAAAEDPGFALAYCGQ